MKNEKVKKISKDQFAAFLSSSKQDPETDVHTIIHDNSPRATKEAVPASASPLLFGTIKI